MLDVVRDGRLHPLRLEVLASEDDADLLAPSSDEELLLVADDGRKIIRWLDRGRGVLRPETVVRAEALFVLRQQLFVRRRGRGLELRFRRPHRHRSPFDAGAGDGDDNAA